MQELYHITLLKNLNSIMAHGLIPQKGLLSQKHGEDCYKTYLFGSKADMESAVQSWIISSLEELYGKGIELCILQVKIPNDFHVDKLQKQELEVSTSDVIPPRYISYYKAI